MSDHRTDVGGLEMLASGVEMMAPIGFQGVALPLETLDDKSHFLFELYDGWSDERVKDYLAAHPEIGSLLHSAVPYLRTHFGSDARIRLKYFRSADEPDDSELFALIQTHQNHREARERFDRFEDDWWDRESERAGCLLSFGLEFLD